MRISILLALVSFAAPALSHASCDCYAHYYSGEEVLVEPGMADQAACVALLDEIERSSDSDYTAAPPVCKANEKTDR